MGQLDALTLRNFIHSVSTLKIGVPNSYVIGGCKSPQNTRYIQPTLKKGTLVQWCASP